MRLIEREGSTFRCPSCRTQCTPAQMKRNKFIDRRIRELLVKCPNFEITKEKALYLKADSQKSKVRQGRLERRGTSRIDDASRDRSRSRSRSRDRLTVVTSFITFIQIPQSIFKTKQKDQITKRLKMTRMIMSSYVHGLGLGPIC